MFNIDLIYGFPEQTAARFVHTLARAAVALEPDRIACYNYAHVPQVRANQGLIATAALPSREANWGARHASGGCRATSWGTPFVRRRICWGSG